jgi:hypothetical protein
MKTADKLQVAMQIFILLYGRETWSLTLRFKYLMYSEDI